MAKSDQNVRWSAIAPFGRLGHRLGWRWVFFFTFPIPFHPWLYRAIPVAALAWLVWLAVGGGEVDWYSPLILAGILAIPLSVPFLQWILFAFRIHFIQALMLPASLLLLAFAVAQREEPLWLATLPACFFLGHAIIAARSKALVEQAAAETSAIDELPAKTGPLPPLVLEGGGLAYSAGHLLEQLAVPVLYTDQDGAKSVLCRIDDDDEPLIAWLSELQSLRNPRVWVSRKGIKYATVRAVELPADAVTLRRASSTGWAASLRGALQGVELQMPDGKTRTYRYGRAAPLSWIPGLFFFMHLQLGSNAAYSPALALVRAKQLFLGKARGESEAAIALAQTLRTDGPPQPLFADPSFIRAAVAAANDEVAEFELRSLDEMLASPGTWKENPFPTLLAEPQRYAHRAAEILAGFDRAREAKRVMAGITIGRLLARLPEKEFADIGDALIEKLNSRLIAEERPLPATMSFGDLGRLPFRGFGLLTQVPTLYRRLAELGDKTLPLLIGLGRLYGWPVPIAGAYRQLTGRPPPIE